MLDYDIIISGFKLYSHYLVHFWANTLRKA